MFAILVFDDVFGDVWAGIKLINTPNVNDKTVELVRIL